MKFLPSISYLIISLGLCVLPGAALAQTAISANFAQNKNTGGTQWNSQLASGASGGVVAAQNWNNLNVSTPTQATPQSLVLNNGSGSGATVIWSTPGGNSSISSIGTPPNPLTMTSGQRLYKDYLNGGASQNNTISVTFSNLSSAFTGPGYNVIVYFDQQSSRQERQRFNITGGTSIFTDVAGNLDFSGTFIRATGTDAASATTGNYVLWEGLTSSSFTVNTLAFAQNTAGQWGSGISAIQIVANPAPEPDVPQPAPIGQVSIQSAASHNEPYVAPTANLSSPVLPATGASINESAIQQTIRVAQDGSGDYRKLKNGINAAVALKNAGTPVRVLVGPGTYREEKLYIKGASSDVPLIIEAEQPGTVIVSGSEVFTNWTQSGSNYQHAWTNNWGVNRHWWTEYGVVIADIGLRRENIWVGGVRQTQVLSASELAPGKFFVDEANDKLVWRPQSGVNPATATIEVATKTYGIGVKDTRHLALRGLIIQHYATTIGLKSNQPIDWDWPGGVALGLNKVKNALVDNVTIRENNEDGLQFDQWNDVTIKDTIAERNGGAGFVGGNLLRVRFENVRAEANNWRGYMGGYTSWSVAGIKVTQLEKVTFDNFSSIDNLCFGFWFDIWGKDVLVDGLTSRGNLLAGAYIEMQQGPITIQNSDICYNRGIGLLISGAANLRMTDTGIAGNAVQISTRYDNRVDPRNFWFENNVIASVANGGVPGIIQATRDGFSLLHAIDANGDVIIPSYQYWNASQIIPGAEMYDITKQPLVMPNEISVWRKFMDTGYFAGNLYFHYAYENAFVDRDLKPATYSKWVHLTGESGSQWYDPTGEYPLVETGAPMLNAQLKLLPQFDADMTAEGNLDFIVPSGNSSGTLTRKVSPPVALSALSIQGNASTGYYAPGYRLTWSDGTPITVSGGLSYSHSLRANASGNQRYTFSAPATTATRTVRIYLDQAQSGVQPRVSASLSDGSAPNVTVSGALSGVVEIKYRAAGEATLHVTLQNLTTSGIIRLFGITSSGPLSALQQVGQDVGVTIPANSFDAESDPGNSFRVRNTGSYLSSLINGTWIRFADFDFGTVGAGSFTATTTTAKAGGVIELRLGSPSGTLIGTLNVPSNGTWSGWAPYTTNNVVGENNADLYMVFKGNSGPNDDQTLFSLRDFRFD